MSDRAMLRTIKDSIFCDLFSHPRYVRELYGTLHPEDKDVAERDIEVVTRQCIVTSHPYNDLGLAVGNRLLILVEAQSTWSNNIAARSLMYAADTLRDWVSTHGVSLYETGPAQLPRPELYVIFTGTYRSAPDVVTLESNFGSAADVSATVHVLRGETGGIVGQYVDCTHIIDRWRSARGRTREAIQGAIHECIERGILVEYLTERENEVIDIMMTLYDVEEIQRTWRRHVAREAKEQGLEQGLEQGRTEGERNLGALVSALLAAGRTDDVALAATDEQARKRLYAEMGIA